MKKMLWMAALTSVAFVGCVNEEVAENNQTQQRKELMFGTPMMYNQSRTAGEILGTEYPDDEMFVVYAVHHNGDFQGWEGENVLNSGEALDKSPFFPSDGVVVQKSSENNYWHITGTTKYYWPENTQNEDGTSTDYKLTFAAHSPYRLMHSNNYDEKYAESVSYGPSGLSIVGFKMPVNPKDHFDLMYSTRTTNAVTSPVAINFKHALASIRFMFVKQAENLGGAHSIHIKKLEVIGEIYNKGKFEQKISNVGDTSGNPEWNYLELVKTEEGKTVDYVLFSDEFTVPEGTSSELPAASVASFLPIPQTVSDNMKVRLTYTVVMNEDEEESEHVLTIPFTDFVKPNSTTYINGWQLGHRYVYHVHFGALKEIFFAPTIAADWVTDGTAGVYEIGNVAEPTTPSGDDTGSNP